MLRGIPPASQSSCFGLYANTWFRSGHLRPITVSLSASDIFYLNTEFRTFLLGGLFGSFCKGEGKEFSRTYFLDGSPLDGSNLLRHEQTFDGLRVPEATIRLYNTIVLHSTRVHCTYSCMYSCRPYSSTKFRYSRVHALSREFPCKRHRKRSCWSQTLSCVGTAAASGRKPGRVRYGLLP